MHNHDGFGGNVGKLADTVDYNCKKICINIRSLDLMNHIKGVTLKM